MSKLTHNDAYSEVYMSNSTFFYDWRQRLKELGFKGSKADAAKQLGISPHTYARYERDPSKAPKCVKLATFAVLWGVK